MRRSSSFVRRGGWTGVAVLLVLGSVSAGLGQHDVAETRVSMNQIFQNLRIVLPLSADPKRFADPAARVEIEGALQSMADAASSLDLHAKGFDPGRRFLGRSLARDVRRALSSYQSGEYERAQFYVHQTVNDCVACHSRMESLGDSPVAADFLRGPEMAGFSPAERAKLQIATRRFDDALATLEAMFASPEFPPAGLVRSVTQYLTISVRVKQDLGRPVPVLKSLRARPDVWAQLRTQLDAWIGALEEFDRQPAPAVDVASARAVLGEGDGLAAYPADRRPLVHYLVASRILSEVVATERTPGHEQAEAYYLLGTTEVRIGSDFWRSPADFYLEQAIRLAPHSDTSKRAFGRLEEAAILEFSGSSGTHLPASLRERLDDLRALAAPAPAAAVGREGP